MSPLPREFVLFDTEFTAWPGSQDRHWTGPGEHRELIQIGAIRVRDIVEVGCFMTYVRPTLNPTLSDFIMDLTAISQKHVDEAPPFPEALTAFEEFVGELPAYSWGSDADVFDENGLIAGDARRLSRERFRDLKPTIVPFLAARGIDESRYSSGTLHQAFDVPATGRAHDALNDVRNLLVALRELV